MIQGHFCELYFCYQISFTSYHQALDARGWGPLCWRVLFSTQNTALLHWKVSNGCHLALWCESSSLMTQESPPNCDPGTATSLVSFPLPFFYHTDFLLSNRLGELLHQVIQIPSSWNIMPLDVYIYDSFTSFKFTHLSLLIKVFLGFLYPLFSSFSTVLITIQYVMSLFKFIIFSFQTRM